MRWEPYNKDASMLCGVPEAGDSEKGYRIVAVHDLDKFSAECRVHMVDDLEHEAFVARIAAGLNLLDKMQHEIGNPVFAIETNLDPLRKRIKDAASGTPNPLGRASDALEIVEEIQALLERIKAALAAKETR